MSALPDCDPKVRQHGVLIALIGNAPSVEIEAFVVELRSVTTCRVDWHRIAGRGRVLGLGEPSEIKRARQLAGELLAAPARAGWVEVVSP